jgi:hypothetical protein
LMKMRKRCSLFLILCLSTIVFGIVDATTQSITVEAGKDFTYTIDLDSQDRVNLDFVTVAQTARNLTISIKFPNSTVLNLEDSDKYSASFTSEISGTCELYFDNTLSSDSSFVALNYNVTHYFLGMPTMIFFLVAIVVLALAAVIGYVIMGKYS